MMSVWFRKLASSSGTILRLAISRQRLTACVLATIDSQVFSLPRLGSNLSGCSQRQINVSATHSSTSCTEPILFKTAPADFHKSLEYRVMTSLMAVSSRFLIAVITFSSFKKFTPCHRSGSSIVRPKSEKDFFIWEKQNPVHWEPDFERRYKRGLSEKMRWLRKL